MTQVDFAIAFVFMLIILTYSIFFVTNNISHDFDTLTTKRLERTCLSLSKQLFDIQDNKSLMTNFKEIQASFQEMGGYSHEEQINVVISPVVSKIHVYDKLFNEIPSSTSSTSDSVTVSFDLNFSVVEKKYVNIFYFGEPSTSINFLNNVTETNITGTILSEKDVIVLSQEKCTNLTSLSYGDSKNLFGFTENFKITNGCDYGPEPPLANLIVKTKTILVENPDETIYPQYLKLTVW